MDSKIDALNKNVSATQAVGSVVRAGAFGIIATATLNHFVNDNFTSLLTPLQPAIAKTYGVGVVETGFLVALLSFAGSMTQPIFGALADRVDKRILVAAGPVLTALGMTTMGYAPNFFILAMLITLGAVGSAMFHPSGIAFVTQNSSLQQRGFYASIFSAGGTVGLALGPLTSNFLGLHGLLWLMPMGLLMGVVSYLIMPQSKPSASAKARNLGDYLAVFHGPIRILWAVNVLRSLSTVTYGSLIPYVFETQGRPHSVTAWTLAIFSLASSLGGIVGGQLSDRLGRTTVLRSSVTLLVPLFAALVFSNPSQFWFFPLAFVVGAIANATIPVGVVAAQEYAPGHAATTSAIMMGFSWGTAGVLYLVFAKLAAITSPQVAMLVSVLLLIPGFFLTLQLPEPKRAKI